VHRRLRRYNPAIHPGAQEICNRLDDDCDGEVDEGSDLDGDGISVCDNCCPTVPNPNQSDIDFDSIGDLCDNCPTIPNVDQNPCVCEQTCGLSGPTISFDSPEGHGSGVVRWSTGREIDKKGARTQLNSALIRCEECVTGVGHAYATIIPKHKNGRGIFLETLRLNGTVEVNGPAQRI